MKKTTLPFVMIASLVTLVSCGTETDLWTTITPVKSPTVTGVVITPTNSTGEAVNTPANSTGVLSPTNPVSVTSPSAPVVLNRKQTVSYRTPGDDVSVEFDVTITDGIITAASSKTLATEDASKYNQDEFAKFVSVKVVGKKAKDLNVDAIGGASLTTTAFLDFVHSL